MYLKRLELQGFKSFADKTVLEFMPGITSVIGPNGSGKSNIADSIRWVLGEQSMKSLRGSKSLDVIFAGTQNRKSLGFAEASLVFDNSDGALPIEYTEVTITRKLYRSGETGYYINKTPCRLKDVLELFMDTGIGKDGYSIIGQGKIDEILSNKSEDRRHIFEEAAGIVKYRARRQETEKKLEQTKLNLLRINDILSEIEANIEPLKMQSEKAKKFLNLRDELKNIEIGLFLFHIDKYKKELEQISEDEEILSVECKQEEGRLERVEFLKNELKDQIEEITTQIEDSTKLGYEKQNNIEKQLANNNISEERIKNNEENKKRFQEEIEELEIKKKQLEEEIQQKQEKTENLQKNREKFEKELEQKQQELDKITQKLSSKEIEIEKLKQIVEENTDQKYELNSQINENNVILENQEKRITQIKQEISLDISELDKLRMTKEDISKEFNKIETERKQNKTILEEAKRKTSIITQEIKVLQTRLNTKANETRMKETRQKFLIETQKEKEGYQRSVKEILKACENNQILKKGMEGVLADLIEVPEEFEVAIEMCLGNNLQNIVTKTEEDAKKLIQYLRNNNLGRASFLPMTAIKGKKLDKIKGKNDGVYGIASDLIKYPKDKEQIILYLLGRTVIVDNMDTAIAIAKHNNYTFRIVTKEGDILNASGAMSGGSVAKRSVPILGRGREIKKLEEEINKYKSELKDIEEEITKKEKQMEEDLEGVSGVESKLQELDISHATYSQRIILLDENIEKIKTKIEKLKLETKNIEENKEIITKKQEDIKKEIQQLTIKMDEYTKTISEFSSTNKETQKTIDDLNFDITNLKISVSSFDESQMSIEEMKQRILADIELNNKSLESKKAKISSIDNENEILKNQIQDTLKQIEEFRIEVKESNEKIEKKKIERIEKNKKLEEQEKEILEKRNRIEEHKQQILKIQMKKSKIEEENTQIINKLWDEYELTPNNVGEINKPENIALTQKKVTSLRKEMRDLGNVNLEAIEEYKTTKERYDFMCEQRVDLEDTMTKLRKIISNMTTVMKEQFREQFSKINKNFEEVFKELFGGGRATLTLEDEDNILECGIDINVQPPGKKLQNMTLLSGGEKAFTAIALLFAILKINPSPFCVLDEIEAALDDVNVYRYAEYLKKFTKDTQFLVITHRKGTMEAADTVYGVTMEESGISKLLSMKLKS